MSDKKQSDAGFKWIKKTKFQCAECPESFTTSKKLKYHSADNYSTKSSNPKCQCFFCDLSFLTFNRLSYHKRISHGESRQKSSENVDLYSFQCSDPQFLQELRSVQHFLVDSKMELRKKTVYNFRLTEYNPTFIYEKLTKIFNELTVQSESIFPWDSFSMTLLKYRVTDTFIRLTTILFSSSL